MERSDNPLLCTVSVPWSRILELRMDLTKNESVDTIGETTSSWSLRQSTIIYLDAFLFVLFGCMLTEISYAALERGLWLANLDKLLTCWSFSTYAYLLHYVWHFFWFAAAHEFNGSSSLLGSHDENAEPAFPAFLKLSRQPSADSCGAAKLPSAHLLKSWLLSKVAILDLASVYYYSFASHRLNRPDSGHRFTNKNLDNAANAVEQKLPVRYVLVVWICSDSGSCMMAGWWLPMVGLNKWLLSTIAAMCQ